MFTKFIQIHSPLQSWVETNMRTNFQIYIFSLIFINTIHVQIFSPCFRAHAAWARNKK